MNLLAGAIVSIPVDGAFLFQVPIRTIDEGSSLCFNPRRWGFFISGTFEAACKAKSARSFNPRRWGFFISGLSLKTLFCASQLYYTVFFCCLYQPCEPCPQKRQTQDFRIVFWSNRSDEISHQLSSSLSGSCRLCLRTVIAVDRSYPFPALHFTSRF